MIIQEPDFIIVKEDGCLRLKIPKSKKELKEGEDPYHTIGYYVLLKGAIKGALDYRKSKKYKGGQSIKELELLLKQYKQSIKKLDNFSKLIYNPILKYKKELFVYGERKLNYWK